MATLVAAYFDDKATVDTVAAAPSGQQCTSYVLTAVGFPPHTTKSFPPSTDRVFLGASCRLALLLDEGKVRFEPKLDTTTRIDALAGGAIADDTLTPVEAGKLRGLHTWADTHTAGRVGRIATYHLKARQYEDTSVMTEPLKAGLRLMQRLSKLRLSWDVPVLIAPRMPLIVYSDASYEPDSGKLPRLGWIIFDPEAGTDAIVAKTLDVPMDIYDSWKPRSQQIYPAEAIAPLVATANDQEVFRGRDVIWFIDNEAAAATLIRGASREEDVTDIAELTQLLWAALGTRVWIEWIDSDSNPSDGLSRDGLDDPWCVSHGLTPLMAVPPRWQSAASLLDELMEKFQWRH